MFAGCQVCPSRDKTIYDFGGRHTVQTGLSADPETRGERNVQGGLASDLLRAARDFQTDRELRSTSK